MVSEAIAIQAKTVWGQLGVMDETVTKVADNSSLNLIMDRCIKVEYTRLNIEHFRSQAN
ncbi:CoA-binding protein [Lyngbya sp. PCC 8106]|uniref:CoA-binding protein n=1 Tax=Lyngbya sp. (strain PCC 8106) TaxID=313612 RepID=UPI000A015F3F|nr:CoA-binding protein [Lyngbya sp. PCC 8106]